MKIHPVVFKVQQALRQMVARSSARAQYVLAVSGGADSMALAHAAGVLQREGRGNFSVCHVEHGLRGAEALRDMELVQAFCAAQGLPCAVRHVDVRALVQREHLSTEDAARRLRYEALRAVARASGAQYIMTAHHADDQAETVLLKLLRGAGVEGLSGMHMCVGDILRPLLALKRAELEEYCCVEGIAHCHDSSNDDLHYTRNRLRVKLLPLLEQEYNPNIRQSLVNLARQVAQDADCLQDLASAGFEAAVTPGDGTLAISISVLAQYHPAVQKRILRLACFAMGCVELSYERTQALWELVQRRTGGKVIQLPGNIAAQYAKKQIIFTKN